MDYKKIIKLLKEDNSEIYAQQDVEDNKLPSGVEIKEPEEMTDIIVPDDIELEAIEYFRDNDKQHLINILDIIKELAFTEEEKEEILKKVGIYNAMKEYEKTKSSASFIGL